MNDRIVEEVITVGLRLRDGLCGLSLIIFGMSLYLGNKLNRIIKALEKR